MNKEDINTVEKELNVSQKSSLANWAIKHGKQCPKCKGHGFIEGRVNA